jgi:hypothetical protein
VCVCECVSVCVCVVKCTCIMSAYSISFIKFKLTDRSYSNQIFDDHAYIILAMKFF